MTFSRIALSAAVLLATLTGSAGPASADNATAFDYHRPRLIPIDITVPAGQSQKVVGLRGIPCPANEEFYITSFEAFADVGKPWAASVFLRSPWMDANRFIPTPMWSVRADANGHASHTFQAPAPTGGTEPGLRINGPSGQYTMLLTGMCGPAAPKLQPPSP